jgi:adenine phosphoribosyltransferase
MLDHDNLPSDHAVRFLKSRLRDVPDFPKPGIVFKDITPLLAEPRAFHIAIDLLTERFVGERIDAVVGIEARGFIFGAAVAARLNASFVPVRKSGKLPAKTDRVSYALEYGEAELEMHVGSLAEGARVVIVDDLLATGGSATAAAELTQRQGGQIIAFAFVIELDFLDGRAQLSRATTNDARVFSLLRFGAGE